MFLSGKGRLDSIPSGFGNLFHRSNGNGAGRKLSDSPSIEPPRAGSASLVGNASEAIGDAARSAASGVKEAASVVGTTASNAAERLGEGASKAVTAAKDTAVGVGESVGDFADTALNATREEAAHLRDQARRVTHDMRDRAVKLAEEQPLIVAVAGIAVGAILAAALPRTKIEDDLMGETSEAIKETAGQVASEQIAKISSEADKVAEEIKETITEHGVTAKAAVNVVRDVGDSGRDGGGRRRNDGAGSERSAGLGRITMASSSRMIALLGLLAVAGYQNRDKLSGLLGRFTGQGEGAGLSGEGNGGFLDGSAERLRRSYWRDEWRARRGSQGSHRSLHRQVASRRSQGHGSRPDPISSQPSFSWSRPSAKTPFLL